MPVALLTLPAYADDLIIAEVSKADGDDQKAQATEATSAMPAEASKGSASDEQASPDPGPSALHHQQQAAITFANEAAEAAGMALSLPIIKRSSNAAGLANYLGSFKKQHRSSASSPTGSTSPASAVNEEDAAASLQQLSYAAEADVQTAAPACPTSPAFDAGTINPGPPDQHNSTAGSDDQEALEEETTPGSNADAVGAGRSTQNVFPAASRVDKINPQKVMAELVEAGVLPAATGKTHCFVQCGQVHGVFSLDSGTILCLCSECHLDGQELTWHPPAAFERHGGMAASKKWRGSIQVTRAGQAEASQMPFGWLSQSFKGCTCNDLPLIPPSTPSAA
jgi:hypothetical protein